MVKKLLLTVILLLLSLSIEVTANEVSLGVKAGDWIEYNVSTTGLPPEGHNVVWAKMEILSLAHNQIIAVNTTTKMENGTFSSMVMTLDPSAGQVDVWAIIPANLNKGSTFYDRNIGNIPIMGEEQKTIGGIMRDTTVYNSSERFKRWDKATGVFLEGTDVLGNYSLTAIFLRTNMWNNVSLDLDPAVFLLSAFGVIMMAAVLLSLIVTRRKGSRQQSADPRIW